MIKLDVNTQMVYIYHITMYGHELTTFDNAFMNIDELLDGS